MKYNYIGNQNINDGMSLKKIHERGKPSKTKVCEYFSIMYSSIIESQSTMLLKILTEPMLVFLSSLMKKRSKFEWVLFHCIMIIWARNNIHTPGTMWNDYNLYLIIFDINILKIF